MTAHLMIFLRNRPFGLSLTVLLAAGLLYSCLPSKTATTPLSEATHIPAEKGFPVFAAGDIADCRELDPADSGAAKTAAAISARLHPGERYAVLALGDTVYRSGLPEEYANCYEPTWVRFKENTFPAPGNHEYFSPSAFGYYAYFGTKAGPAGRGYYSFDIDNWHLVSINSNLQPAEHAAQLAWLTDDLKQHKSSCTLAYWHHPRFSSGYGNNEKMKDLWQALQAARADVILSGHDHLYERYAPQDADGHPDAENGIRQFVVGTGGAKLKRLLWRKGNSETGDNTNHGVLKLSLRSGSYEWEFIPATDSSFSDRGVASCHHK